ncbi:MAG: SRPBCC family protein [Elusimicrobiota bacterium]
MRKMESAIVIQKSPREVWERLRSPECWQELTNAFANRHDAFRCILVGGADVGVGTEVDLTTARGKPVLRWRVSEWSPLKSMELAGGQSESWINPFQMMLRFQLEELDTDTTRVTASLVLIFLNRMLEVFSLILPVGFMYDHGLKRSLTRLRESV